MGLTLDYTINRNNSSKKSKLTIDLPSDFKENEFYEMPNPVYHTLLRLCNKKKSSNSKIINNYYSFNFNGSTIFGLKNIGSYDVRLSDDSLMLPLSFQVQPLEDNNTINLLDESLKTYLEGVESRFIDFLNGNGEGLDDFFDLPIVMDIYHTLNHGKSHFESDLTPYQHKIELLANELLIQLGNDTVIAYDERVIGVGKLFSYNILKKEVSDFNSVLLDLIGGEGKII